MITLLSPTKTQSAIATDNHLAKTKPLEIKKTEFLVSLLKKRSVDELSKIMKTSDLLAKNTKKLIDAWSNEPIHGTPAIYLFQGDAFQKLDAASLNHDEITFSQEHLVILSALYGYLRPLDSVSAYRLDMKDGLIIPEYRNLYQYWKEAVTNRLNDQLSKQKNNIILNLASNEYVDIIDQKKLMGNIVDVEFKIHKNNMYKTVGIYAKRSRGLLARHIIKNKIDTPEKIVKFNADGFQFSDRLSKPDHYVFILK